MRSADVYLNFAGNAREAFEFYRAVFGKELESLLTYADFGGSAGGQSDTDMNRVAHVSIRLTPTFVLMGSDVPTTAVADFVTGTNAWINLNPESPEEARRLYDALVVGGRQAHALEKTDWAELFGSLVDRYGVRWMFNYWTE